MKLIDISRSLTSRSQWSSPRAIKQPKDLSFRRKIDKFHRLSKKKLTFKIICGESNGMILIVSRKMAQI